uniref:pecanex-like protein 1 n=1 Tax=Pristiophorus japonicus TaxID=55135 RepID=UPI00398E9F92
MGWELVGLLRRGVWAALTGGCYLEPQQGGFANTFHLYLWLALLAAPFVLHLAASPSKVALGIYCATVALLFTVIKTINYRLHVMFEEGEIIRQSAQTAAPTKDRAGSGARDNHEPEPMPSVSPGRRNRVQDIQLTEFRRDSATPPVHHSSWQSILDPGVSDDSDLPTNPKDAEALKEKDFRRLTAAQESNVLPLEPTYRALLMFGREREDLVLNNAAPLMPYDSPVRFRQSVSHGAEPNRQEQRELDTLEEPHSFLALSAPPCQSAARPFSPTGRLDGPENTQQQASPGFCAVWMCANPAHSEAAPTEIEDACNSPERQASAQQFMAKLNRVHECPNVSETECNVLVTNAGTAEPVPLCNTNTAAGENTSCGKCPNHSQESPGTTAGCSDCGEQQPLSEPGPNPARIRTTDPRAEEDDLNEPDCEGVRPDISASLTPAEHKEIELYLDKDSSTFSVGSLEPRSNQNNSIQDPNGTPSLPNMQEPDLLDIPVTALELPETGRRNIDIINNANLIPSSFLCVNVSKGIQIPAIDKSVTKTDLAVRPKSSNFLKQALSSHQYDKRKSRRQVNVGADSTLCAGNEYWVTTAVPKDNKSEDEDTSDHTSVSSTSSLQSHHNLSLGTSSSTNSQSCSSPDHTYHNCQNPHRPTNNTRAVSDSFLKVVHCLIENQRQREQQAVGDCSLQTHIRVLSADGGADVVLSRTSRGSTSHQGRTLTTSKSDLEAKEGQIPNESNFIEFISLLESINSSRMNAAGWTSECGEEGAMGGGTIYVTLGSLCFVN